jgi:thiol-disulfide isomerase/thioredoxin
MRRVRNNTPLLLLLLGLGGPAALGADFGSIPLESLQAHKPTTLAAHGGRVLLVNFWATWCVPCRQEFPELQALQERLRETWLEVVGVTADEDEAKVRQFVQKSGVTFPILLDRASALHQALDLNVMPSTALVDATGRIVKIYRGYNRARGLEEMEKDVRALAEKRS